MAYPALFPFLDPIAPKDDIPDDQKTPAYWAKVMGERWSGLDAGDLAIKLEPFFEEFNRMCEKLKEMEQKAADMAQNGSVAG